MTFLIHRPSWIGLTTLLLLLSFSTASAASAPDSSDSPESPTQSASPETVESNGDLDKVSNATAQAVELKRSSNGDLTSLTARIHNNGTENIHANNFSSSLYEDYRHTHLSGVTLRSGDKSTRHHPLIDAEQNCTCSGYVSRLPYDPLIDPNQSVDYWTLYSLPEEAQKVTVEIPGFDPIEDVPIDG